MSDLIRIALPVPATGTALGDAGDDYVASLSVGILVDGVPLDALDGDTFEAIMTATRLRHLAFHPRTRAFVPGEMKAASLHAAIERHWSSIDAHASELPDLTRIADIVAKSIRTATTVAWMQMN